MKKKALTITGLLVVLCAYAAEWQLVASNSSEEDYISADTMKVEGDLIYYHKRAVLLDAKSSYKLIYGPKAHHTITYMMDNCRTKTTKILRIEVKDADGNDIMKAATPSDVAATPVVENSLIEKTHQFACTVALEKQKKNYFPFSESIISLKK